MADVTGPISSLPGSGHSVPNGTMCDEHPDRPAVARVQGETDSFGCEMIDCCEECRAEMLAAIRADREGTCDWCRRSATDLRDRRDYEEGMCGRVYRVCGACVAAADKRLEEESW